MEPILIGIIVMGILAKHAISLARPRSRDEDEIRLHPYTTRKLAERKYRHFDDGGWTPWENGR